MSFRDILLEDKNEFNKQAPHPLQAYEWGEFRRKTGVTVIRKGRDEKKEIIDGIQLTIHPIPYTPWNIGYFPKSRLPTKEIIEELLKIGKDQNCIFIQLEPNIPISTSDGGEAATSTPPRWNALNLKPAHHPLFTKYTFILDLTKSEDELLKNMHPKTRYNIRVAQKHGVEVAEDNSDEAFETYLKLTEETTKRQKFYAHNEQYHRLMWETLKMANRNNLKAHLLLAKYQNNPLVAWILFSFHDTLYYPYGASSSKHREVMASNLIMWEAIRFGKKIGMKNFDMWGALGENPDTNDPWYGFHRFKEGYGPRHVTYIGSYDLVINPMLYELYKIADRLRWIFLKTWIFSR